MKAFTKGEKLTSEDKIFSIIGAIIYTGLFTLAALKGFGILNLVNDGYPCGFRMLTGFYCPGCGGTHAVYSLISFDIISSIKENPFVTYCGFYFAFLLLWNGISLLILKASRFFCSKGKKINSAKVYIFHFRTVHIYVGLAILLLNWIVKNILLCFGITLF